MNILFHEIKRTRKIINDSIEALTRKSMLVSDYLSLMLGKPRIRITNMKTSLRFPCLGHNPIIESINLGVEKRNRYISGLTRPI